MPDEPLAQQPISDDQELAKVLAGVSQEVESTVPTPMSVPPVPQVANEPDVDSLAADPIPAPAVEPLQPSVAPTMTSGGDSLDSVKLEALNELRPLVDKLNVSSEEKFDTYLLLLRSTDDKALIAPAHEAAKGIADEARRAQALLDIIKEIDFLSQSQQQ
jgi:hypothetical protein